MKQATSKIVQFDRNFGQIPRCHCPRTPVPWSWYSDSGRAHFAVHPRARSAAPASAGWERMAQYHADTAQSARVLLANQPVHRRGPRWASWSWANQRPRERIWYSETAHEGYRRRLHRHRDRYVGASQSAILDCRQLTIRTPTNLARCTNGHAPTRLAVVDVANRTVL